MGGGWDEVRDMRYAKVPPRTISLPLPGLAKFAGKAPVVGVSEKSAVAASTFLCSPAGLSTQFIVYALNLQTQGKKSSFCLYSVVGLLLVLLLGFLASAVPVVLFF